MSAPLRQRCRQCRGKLPAPTESEHRGFCTRYCYDRFYRTRCLVCERRIDTDPPTGNKRDLSSHRKYCGRKCASTARSNPPPYAGPPARRADARSAHLTGLKSGTKDDRRAPREPVLDLRIVPDDRWPGMYRLRLPDGSLTDMVNLTRANALAELRGRP